VRNYFGMVHGRKHGRDQNYARARLKKAAAGSGKRCYEQDHPGE